MPPPYLRSSTGIPALALILLIAGATACQREKKSASPSIGDKPQGTTPDPQQPASNASTPNGSEGNHRFRFTEQAAALGIEFAYRNGEEAGLFSIVESLGGGVGLLDYDGDGRLDLFAVGGGTFDEAKQRANGNDNALYRNGGERFSEVASLAHILSPPFYTHGVAAADYNEDGFCDLLITGFGGVALFTNMGDGTFANATEACKLAIDGCATSAVWGDMDLDGALDLYVARYVNWSFKNNPLCTSPSNGQRDICPPSSFDPVSHFLFLGDGEGGFVDATRASGLREDGKGLGVVSADVDGDGDLDLYVANDTTDNFLYLNDGQARFDEVGVLHGVARDDRGLPNGSMGVDAADYDGDGQIDLWVANYERESNGLYHNQGKGRFVHKSRSSGIAALGGGFVGFGTKLFDFDADGRFEIVCTNGHVIKYPTAAPRQQVPLLISFDGKRFVRQVFEKNHFFSLPHEGRGLALGDLDGNGTQDVVITHLNQPLAVLLNQSPPKRKQVRVRLIGRSGNRDAIGATLIAETPTEKSLHPIVGGGSYLSSGDRTIWLTIPEGEKELTIRVRWPKGGESSLQLVPSEDNKPFRVIEPAGDQGGR